ncbi:hypothetical protein, partial [bacterium endosymbiont of Bathymodiolus sp. 5 South]
MKIIKLFVIHILLLSSFQTFAAFFITTPNVSTPENRDKVIKLTVNTGKRDAPSFRILDGADNDWFDIDDDELTFKATAFRAQKDNMHNTYHVDIVSDKLVNVGTPNEPKFKFEMTPVKTIAVTVTKINLNDGGFHITTAANVDTLEKTNKVIRLTTASLGKANSLYSLVGFAILPSADNDKFTLNGSELTFKATDFKAQNNTYRVNIKATWMSQMSNNDFRTDVKTLTVTVHNGELHITTADTFFENENTVISIRLTVDRSGGAKFAITGGEKDRFTFHRDGFGGDILLFEGGDFETKAIYSVEITAIREDLGLVAKKTITVEIYDLDDEPPTNVQINGAAVIDGQVILANDKDAGFLIGTLSATDPDTNGNAFTFTTDSDDFKIVNGNEIKTKYAITDIRDIPIIVTVSDGNNWHRTNHLSIQVVDAKEIGTLKITNTGNVSVSKNKQKEIGLTANKGGVNFSITGGTKKDKAKFSLSDAKLIFNATNFKDGDNNTYRVDITATRGSGSGRETATQTLIVTVYDLIEDPTTGGSAKSDNAKVTAQAVRKESKSASKLLLSKVGRTLM